MTVGPRCLSMRKTVVHYIESKKLAGLQVVKRMRAQISQLLECLITHHQIEVARRLTLEKIQHPAHQLSTKPHHNSDGNIIMTSYFPVCLGLRKWSRGESPEGQTLSRTASIETLSSPQELNFPYLCVVSAFPERGGGY